MACYSFSILDNNILPVVKMQAGQCCITATASYAEAHVESGCLEHNVFNTEKVLQSRTESALWHVLNALISHCLLNRIQEQPHLKSKGVQGP